MDDKIYLLLHGDSLLLVKILSHKWLLRTAVKRQGRLARYVTLLDVLRYGLATAFINSPVTSAASGVQGENISFFQIELALTRHLLGLTIPGQFAVGPTPVGTTEQSERSNAGAI